MLEIQLLSITRSTGIFNFTDGIISSGPVSGPSFQITSTPTATGTASAEITQNTLVGEITFTSLNVAAFSTPTPGTAALVLMNSNITTSTQPVVTLVSHTVASNSYLQIFSIIPTSNTLTINIVNFSATASESSGQITLYY